MIVAASQSFLLAVLILQKHRALFANRFLAALLLSFTVILLHMFFQDTGVYRRFPVLYLAVGIPLAASQLQYLYTKYLLGRESSFRRSDWLHFLPFALFETGMGAAMLFGWADFTDAAIASPETAPLFFRALNWVFIAQGVTYMSASLRLIVRYDRHLKDVISSSLDEMRMTWLRNITIAGLTAWSLFFVEDLLLTQGVNLSNFVFVSVLFSLYVYAMGFVGLTKSEIFASPAVEETMQQVSRIDADERTAGAKYERSGLTPDAAEALAARVTALMETDSVYTDPMLTLAQLADTLSASPHHLSEAINTRLGKNFYDLVNGHRIARVKRDLADPAKRHLKILSIAFDAGFNSKASFNTLFKEQTGVTPSEYRKSILHTSGDE